jgi:hypothetical protein
MSSSLSKIPKSTIKIKELKTPKRPSTSIESPALPSVPKKQRKEQEEEKEIEMEVDNELGITPPTHLIYYRGKVTDQAFYKNI